MNPDTEKLHRKHIDKPPKGRTSEDIRRMGEDDLLDMDYFLNEDDLLHARRFHTVLDRLILLLCPLWTLLHFP